MNGQDFPKNGWNEWAKYVLKTLEEVKEHINKNDRCAAADKAELLKAMNEITTLLTGKITDSKEETAKDIAKIWTKLGVLETKVTQKAALTGALSGLVPIILTLVIWLITKGGA